MCLTKRKGLSGKGSWKGKKIGRRTKEHGHRRSRTLWVMRAQDKMSGMAV